jgi:hypothetical protein
MVKCRFGATIRKRLDPRKATETKLKLVAHDIRRIGYIEILDGITHLIGQGKGFRGILSQSREDRIE